MSFAEHKGMQEPTIEREKVLNSLSVIESTFRAYRDTLLEQSGHINFTEKDDKSLVTELDLEIEKAAQSAVSEKFSNLPVYGEETGYTDGQKGTFWLIDPIDGTKSLIDGTPSFSNMAALIENGETKAAIIYNPSRDDVYTAIRGEGTFKNGNRVDITKLDPKKVVLCKDEFADNITAMLSSKNITTMSPPSGGGDGFTQILDGLVVARFQMHASGFAHDYAPGALLVSEAGGVIIPIKNGMYTYESNSFVASHPSLAGLIAQNVAILRMLDQ